MDRRWLREKKIPTSRRLIFGTAGAAGRGAISHSGYLRPQSDANSVRHARTGSYVARQVPQVAWFQPLVSLGTTFRVGRLQAKKCPDEEVEATDAYAPRRLASHRVDVPMASTWHGLNVGTLTSRVAGRMSRQFRIPSCASRTAV